MGKCWRLRWGRLGQLLLRLFVQEMDCEGRCGRETAGLAIFTGEGGAAARMEKKRIEFDMDSFWWLSSPSLFHRGSIVKQRNGANYERRQFL